MWWRIDRDPGKSQRDGQQAQGTAKQLKGSHQMSYREYKEIRICKEIARQRCEDKDWVQIGIWGLVWTVLAIWKGTVLLLAVWPWALCWPMPWPGHLARPWPWVLVKALPKARALALKGHVKNIWENRVLKPLFFTGKIPYKNHGFKTIDFHWGPQGRQQQGTTL